MPGALPFSGCAQAIRRLPGTVERTGRVHAGMAAASAETCRVWSIGIKWNRSGAAQDYNADLRTRLGLVGPAQ